MIIHSTDGHTRTAHPDDAVSVTRHWQSASEDSLALLMVTSTALRDEAYGWVADCFATTYDECTDIEDANPRVIVSTIARHYDGGIPSFLLASAPLLPPSVPAHDESSVVRA